MKRKYYAGIGSRETPDEIQNHMKEIAKRLSRAGWTLRSGFAEGADEAFEIGHGKGLKEIYLPWKAFRDHPSTLVNFPRETMQIAYEIASKYHPAWDKCNSGARKLHARNVFQVLGHTFDKPVDYVICWTRDGKDTGGTGQAIRIAWALDIPVLNFYNDSDLDRAYELTK